MLVTLVLITIVATVILTACYERQSADQAAPNNDLPLASKFDREQAFAHIQMLVDEIGPRVAGSEQEQASANSSSDHASFQAIGVPAIIFHRGGGPPIHTSADTAEIIDIELLGETTRAGIIVIQAIISRDL